MSLLTIHSSSLSSLLHGHHVREGGIAWAAEGVLYGEGRYGSQKKRSAKGSGAIMTLRQFLYLDRDLVRELLAQAEGGLYDESKERRSSEGRSGFAGGAGAGPVHASAEKGKSSQSESESIVSQTAASEFDRLYKYLDAQDLQIYDVVDQAEGIPIRRKDFVEVDVALRISGLNSVLGLMGKFLEFMPVLEAVGSEPGLDPDQLDGMKALAALASDDSATLPVIGTVPGSAGLRIGMELRKAALMTTDLEAEATALVKVQRVLRSGDREIVGDPFGGLMKAVPREKRDELLGALQTEQVSQLGIGESEVAYPGLLATAVAIFR